MIPNKHMQDTMTFSEILDKLIEKAENHPNAEQIAYIQVKNGFDKVVSEVKSGDHCVYTASPSEILSKDRNELLLQLDKCISEYWIDGGF